jgi:hypothetical protein
MKCYCTRRADIGTMGRASRTIAFVLLMALVIPISSGALSTHTSATQKSPTWTFMVYMAEDYYIPLSWQDDVNEMEAADRAPGMNVIALVDPYGPNNSFILNVTHDPNNLDPTIVSQKINDSGAVITNGEVNMALSSTLSDFINFSAMTYPADHYVLDLWGHGAGWRGVCPDGNDILTLPRMRTALEQSTNDIGRKLDLLIIDSCAEANVETLWEIGDYVDYYVASEKDVPYQGLPYTPILNGLASHPDQGVARLGASIVHDYVEWSKTGSIYSATMAEFNLTRGYATEPPMNAINYYDPIFHDTFVSVLNSTEYYENASTVDYGDFLRLLMASDVPLEMRYLALEQLRFIADITMAFEMFSNLYATDGVLVKNATGLTIYVPSSEFYDDPYNDLMFSQAGWEHTGRLLSGTTSTIPNGPAPTVTYAGDLPDSVTISMPSTYGSIVAAAFLELPNGLVDVSGQVKTGPEILLSGIAGHICMDVSTSNDPSHSAASSYHLVNVTLYGTARIDVSIVRADEPVPADDFNVIIGFSDGNMSAHYSDGAYHASIMIPTNASIGDMVRVEVIGKDTGRVLGDGTLLVSQGNMSVQVLIPAGRPGSPVELVVPLLLSLFPGILMLAFALLLRSERKKKV